ncbi:histidine phosphatase family protein [Gordonia soli]|uniref:Putative phosphoglycerate mutase n=1 Tax=Gordonia soli NBRC 108243 TaxID=1223545 RepID=M0QRA2_9ACTN|nr:histidine phosphatase family protein [Gordonia soli]GAC70949.1 putative phosphoglycerate mutase [Gordonia soli NBRC 108243]
MARLHLVRHGQTTSNVLKRLDTALPGASLTDFGARQAARFALEQPPRGEVVVVSSLARRARETAALIGSVWGVEAGTVDGVHEVQVGDLEDRWDSDAHEVFRTVVDRWYGGEPDVEIPGGESLSQVRSRFLPVIDGLVRDHLSADDPPDVYLVSHGAAIRLVAAHLAGIDGEFAAATHLNNLGSIELDLVDGRWECRRWGAVFAPFEPPQVDEPLVVDPMG